jgi:hypothetical protein
MSKRRAKKSSIGQEIIESLREFVEDVRRDRVAAERKYRRRVAPDYTNRHRRAAPRPPR